MPYICGLDCNLVRNDSQISKKNPLSHIFVDWKKLTPEKYHICETFWTDAAVPENVILFFFLPKLVKLSNDALTNWALVFYISFNII